MLAYKSSSCSFHLFSDGILKVSHCWIWSVVFKLPGYIVLSWCGLRNSRWRLRWLPYAEKAGLSLGSLQWIFENRVKVKITYEYRDQTCYSEGRDFQQLPRDLANVNALENNV